MASIRLPSMGLRLPPRVKAAKVQNVSIGQVAKNQIVPSSFGQGIVKPIKVKAINVRNKGFNIH